MENTKQRQDIRCESEQILPEFGTTEEEEQRAKQIRAIPLLGQLPCGSDDGWKTTVGMFDKDPIIREISEQARRIRTSQRGK